MTERKDKKKTRGFNPHTKRMCICLLALHPPPPRVVWLEREMNIQIQVWMQLLEAEQMLTGWRAVCEESKANRNNGQTCLQKPAFPGLVLCYAFRCSAEHPTKTPTGSAPHGVTVDTTSRLLGFPPFLVCVCVAFVCVFSAGALLFWPIIARLPCDVLTQAMVA